MIKSILIRVSIAHLFSEFIGLQLISSVRKRKGSQDYPSLKRGVFTAIE